MNLSSAKYGLSSLSEKLKNNTIPENPDSYIYSLDIAIECIELIQHLQSSSCDHCRLRILDGGYRCLLLPHPEDFIEECGVNIAYKNCPLRIHKELNNGDVEKAVGQIILGRVKHELD